jgi:hypothetical protein
MTPHLEQGAYQQDQIPAVHSEEIDHHQELAFGQ